MVFADKLEWAFNHSYIYEELRGKALFSETIV